MTESGRAAYYARDDALKLDYIQPCTPEIFWKKNEEVDADLAELYHKKRQKRRRLKESSEY